MRRKTLQAVLMFGLAVFGPLAGAPGNAQAQSWPTKPVKVIVPATPGGTIDPLTRVVADALSSFETMTSPGRIPAS